MYARLKYLGCAVALLVGYFLSNSIVEAGTASAGNPVPAGSTSGGGGIAIPWFVSTDTTKGGVDVYGPNGPPQPGDPGYDPDVPPDYDVMCGYNNDDYAQFVDENSIIGQTAGYSAGSAVVQWRGAVNVQMTTHVKTHGAPGGNPPPQGTTYKTRAVAACFGRIHPEPLPSGGTLNEKTKSQPDQIVNESHGEITGTLNWSYQQPDPNDPTQTLNYCISGGAGATNKVKFSYGISGTLTLEAYRPEVAVAGHVKTTSVSAIRTAWELMLEQVINNAEGTPGVLILK